MGLKNATLHDKRGLIAESYHIDDLNLEAARAIFLDWAMMDSGTNPSLAIEDLWLRYGENQPVHPMSILLKEGLDKVQMPRKRRRKNG